MRFHRLCLGALLILLFSTRGWGDTEVAASSRRAFFLSLAVPGAGQYYLGERTWARRFLLVEGLLWLGYFGFRTYGNWQEQDYRLFAAHHAGVRLEEMGSLDEEQFFDSVGFYSSAREYNRVARWKDGADADLYPEEPMPAWEWAHEEARLRFRALRSTSITTHRRALYILAGVIINHVLSGIQAAQMAGSVDENPSTSSWHMEPLQGPGIGVCVVVDGM